MNKLIERAGSVGAVSLGAWLTSDSRRAAFCLGGESVEGVDSANEHLMNSGELLAGLILLYLGAFLLGRSTGRRAV